VFLGLTQVALYALSLYFRFKSGKAADSDAILRSLTEDISGAIFRIWAFARPIVQLIVVLTKEDIAAFNALVWISKRFSHFLS
jgi:hypothetical protein